MKSKLSKILKDDLGVERVYFCAGARNNLILNELGDQFELIFKLDERSASFEALGSIMCTDDKPVVVCTTSGTAVAECLPAVIEAYYHGLPLIIISGDRPKRLRETHAAQTIDQLNIFSTYVNSKYSGELSGLDQLDKKFPMHLNFEIDDSDNSGIVGAITDLEEKDLNLFKRPLVFLSQGCDLSQSDIDFLDRLPIYKYHECLSEKWFKPSGNLIKFEKTIARLIDVGAIDSIIHIGKTPVAKLWREIERKESSFPVLNLGRQKFGLSRGYTYTDKTKLFNFLNTLAAQADIEEVLPKEHFKDLPHSEISVVSAIIDNCSCGDIIFAGNSMPIRYVELCKRDGIRYIASRGANGIDGQIATAIGIAKNTQKDVTAILGDLTFLYDFSSLFGTLPNNLKIHVLDNQGGRIFERVDVDQRMINPPEVSCLDLVTKLGLLGNIKVHQISNEETSSFWKRWNR